MQTRGSNLRLPLVGHENKLTLLCSAAAREPAKASQSQPEQHHRQATIRCRGVIGKENRLDGLTQRACRGLFGQRQLPNIVLRYRGGRPHVCEALSIKT